MVTPTDTRCSALELQAVNNVAESDPARAEELVQALAKGYGLPALPAGATYGLDLDTGELLAP